MRIAAGRRLRRAWVIGPALVLAVVVSVQAQTLADDHLRRGLTYAREGSYEAARAEYEAALQRRPGFSQAHAGLADVYERLGNLQSALRHWEAASSLVPGNRHYRDNANRVKALIPDPPRQEPAPAVVEMMPPPAVTPAPTAEPSASSSPVVGEPPPPAVTNERPPSTGIELPPRPAVQLPAPRRPDRRQGLDPPTKPPMTRSERPRLVIPPDRDASSLPRERAAPPVYEMPPVSLVTAKPGPSAGWIAIASLVLAGALWLAWSRLRSQRPDAQGATTATWGPGERGREGAETRRLVALDSARQRAESGGDPDAADRAVAEAHDLIWAWLEKQRGSGDRIDPAAISAHVDEWADKFERHAWSRTMATRYRDLGRRYVETGDVLRAHSCFDFAAILAPQDIEAAYNRHLTMAALLARSSTPQALDAAIEEAEKAMSLDASANVSRLIETLLKMRRAVDGGTIESLDRPASSNVADC